MGAGNLVVIVSHGTPIGDSENMSSHQRTQGPSRAQQTLQEAVASKRIQEFPRGIILRAELPHDNFERFLRGNVLITYVMINFCDVAEVLDDYGSLDAVLEPWQIPIVSATEPDEILQNRTRDEIRRVLKQIQPAIYVPDTGTVYKEDSKAEQLGGIREYKIRLKWLVQEIEKRGWEIELLPLAKGMKQWHFREYLDLFNQHRFSNFAFYTRQYCGGSVGNRINDLVDHIHNFDTVVNPDNILAIARHGESHLEKLPQCVTGASGLTQFIKHCSDNRGNYSMDLFTEWRPQREDALFANHGHNQPKLNEYATC